MLRPVIKAALLASCIAQSPLSDVTLAVSGAQNQLWNLDAFPQLTTLAPYGNVTLLNVSAPDAWHAVTSLHLVITPDDGDRMAMNRGVELVVTYDGDATLSFSVPVGAFFADAWGSTSSTFESVLFSKRNTNSLHSRASMPFRRAVVILLVSHIASRVEGYTIATYELNQPPPVPGVSRGYFFAQYAAQDSPHWPFEATRVFSSPLIGAGHVVAVGYTATTTRSDIMTVADHFNGVCEGNWNWFVDNSTALPGNSTDPALLAWLGSEDFFGQSYGWTKEVFERAGTTLIAGVPPSPIQLATYRTLTDAPIRFRAGLTAAIQWDWDHARIPSDCLGTPGACPVNFTVTTHYYLVPAAGA
jgi:hypothetical protein